MLRRPFEIVLPSGSCNVDFPDNRQSNFRVKLHHPVQLNGSYEVSLANIVYNHSFYNLPENRSSLNIEFGGVDCEITCNYGNYLHVARFLHEIERAIKEHSKANSIKDLDNAVKFSYDTTRSCVTMEIVHQSIPTKVKFKNPSLVGTLLGFQTGREYVGGVPGLDENNLGLLNERFIGHPDVETIKTFYVYTDIIQYGFVGGAYTPLLRHFTATGKFSETQERDFLDKYYKTVSVSELNSIHIGIYDNSGNEINFLSGEVIVVLKFRPVLGF